MTSHLRARPLLALAALLALTGGVPDAAAAQEPAVETLVPGRRSVTFRALSGTNSFGIWHMRDERTNLGLLVDVAIDYDKASADGDDNDLTDFSLLVGVGPEVRRYADISGRVAPYGFLGARLGLGWEWRHDEPFDDESGWMASLGGSVGLGAEFFPIRSFSLNVQTGVGSTIAYRPIQQPGPDPSIFHFDVGTFTTSIGGAIYF